MLIEAKYLIKSKLFESLPNNVNLYNNMNLSLNKESIKHFACKLFDTALLDIYVVTKEDFWNDKEYENSENDVDISIPLAEDNLFLFDIVEIRSL